MTPLNNVSINTLDKSYNVFSTSNSKSENANKPSDINESSIENNINYDNELKFATEDEAINSQVQLKNILDNVKNNIKNTNLSNVHQVKLSNKVLSLLS